MGKSSKPTIGFWYDVAYHHGLTIGPIDAFLEYRGGDKVAWQGLLTSSGTITVNAPNLWGGEKDQGGIVGNLNVMFGEPTQMPNPYLVSVFGDRTAAWRGFCTVVFEGGRYGAMNPYPQPASYKIRRILEGWDGGTAWYPEKAPIQVGSDSTEGTSIPVDAEWLYQVEAPGSTADYSSPGYDDTGWAVGAGGFGTAWSGGPVLTPGTVIPAEYNKQIWIRKHLIGLSGADVAIHCWHDDAVACWWNGELVQSNGVYGAFDLTIPANKVTGDDVIVFQVVDSLGGGNIFLGVTLDSAKVVEAPRYMNPAHVLYESRTNGDMGREPVENINDASLRAAADTLFDEGFGICPQWDPASESVEDFENRIQKLIGGSFSRSPEDGQWYLDLARGVYVLDDLPILTDDDILDFKEQPSTFENAINSVSVKYFDPERKETIVTAPVRALGLVATFGTIHQTYDYPEIPTADLALRVALRELLATTTPTRGFDLVTTRVTYAWRPNQYFRLQAPKRGIADMVCLVGEKSNGTLRSGAIRLKAAQDIYSLPATSFVQVEPGVDPNPSQTPTAITTERAIEAPYVQVVSGMTSSEFAALSDSAGFAMAFATPASTEIDFTMMVAPAGGSYTQAGHGSWAATATVNETATKTGTAFTLSAGRLLSRVSIGMGALWDNEEVRVDDIDDSAGTVTLARGCADTVPVAHSAGSRIWFYEVGFAYDATEFTDGETVNVKLLSNTGSQQLSLGLATPLPITFDQRLARPYPPGKVKIGGADWPSTVTGSIAVTWAHRDRGLQADQLIDTTAASIGPESTVRYGLAFYRVDTNALLVQRTDLGSDNASAVLAYTGDVRMVLWSLSDNADSSWQKHEHVFTYTPPGGTTVSVITGDTYVPPSGTIIDGGVVTGGTTPPPPAPDVPSGGTGSTSSLPARARGTTVVDPVTYGADPTGVADSTAAFNAAFAALPTSGANQGGIVRPSAGVYKIDPNVSVKPLTKTLLDLETHDVTLQESYTAADHKYGIWCQDITDFEIAGGTIIGYRDAWSPISGTTSEWGHCIAVFGVLRGTIRNLTAKKAVGDAISIAAHNGTRANDVIVDNCVLTYCRRQGVSLGLSDNVKIQNNEISHIGGTAPQAGIDVEPDNYATSHTTTVTIDSNYIHDCSGPGIQCYKSADGVTITNNRLESNNYGLYAYNSHTVTFTGNTVKYSRNYGLKLGGTCSGYTIGGAGALENTFFSNRTDTYPKKTSGSTTAITGQNTTTAKHITIASTVTSTTVSTNLYGP